MGNMKRIGLTGSEEELCENMDNRLTMDTCFTISSPKNRKHCAFYNQVIQYTVLNKGCLSNACSAYKSPTDDYDPSVFTLKQFSSILNIYRLMT